MTERLALVVYRGCVAPFFPPDTLPLSLVLSPSSLLSRDLSLDSLGCEELASHVSLCCGAPLSGDEVERCSSLWDVALLAASRLTAWQTDTKMWDWADTSLPTTWTMEMRSRGKQMLYGTDSGAASGASGLLSCPVGFSKDDKLFSRLRRTKRAVSRQFVHFWQSCAKNEQQRILLLAAPLPMDANDKDFPVSLALLPNVHVEALLGDGLPIFLEARCEGEFRVVVRDELERIRNLSALFSCPPEWEGRVMLLDGRQEVKIKSHKDEARVRDQLVAGQAVPGKIWALYLAAFASVAGLLQAVLDEFSRRQKAKKTSALGRGRACDACGKFAEKTSVCGRCRERYFCGRQCQTDDWPLHKKNCGEKKPAFALLFDPPDES